MPLSAGERLGPYEIVPPIGKGGMGEVYQARDTQCFGVAPDGKRFLIETIPGIQGGRRMEVVVNWFDELRRRVPTGQ